MRGGISLQFIDGTKPRKEKRKEGREKNEEEKEGRKIVAKASDGQRYPMPCLE